MANSCQACEGPHGQTLRGTTPGRYPRSLPRASTRRTRLARPSQNPLALDHNTWGPPAMSSPTAAAWSPPATASVHVAHPLPQQTTSGVHQQRRESVDRIDTRSAQQHPQHPQVMKMSVRHRMDRKRSRAAHLAHTIRWCQVTWPGCLTTFRRFDDGRCLRQSHSFSNMATPSIDRLLRVGGQGSSTAIPE